MRKKIVFLSFIWLLVICFFDYKASKYGTGIIFESNQTLSFDYEIDFYEGKFMVLTNDNEYSLITPGFTFPIIFLERRKTDLNYTYVERVLAFGVFKSQFCLLIEDENKTKKVINVKSIRNDGIAKEYDIIDYSGESKQEWILLDKNQCLMLQLQWRKIFFFLIGIYLFVGYIFVKRSLS